MATWKSPPFLFSTSTWSCSAESPFVQPWEQNSCSSNSHLPSKEDQRELAEEKQLRRRGNLQEKSWPQLTKTSLRQLMEPSGKELYCFSNVCYVFVLGKRGTYWAAALCLCLCGHQKRAVHQAWVMSMGAQLSVLPAGAQGIAQSVTEERHCLGREKNRTTWQITRKLTTQFFMSKT